MLKVVQKRILIISKVFSTGFGVGLVVKKQLEHLLKKGYNDLHIATSDINPSTPPIGVQLHIINESKKDFHNFLTVFNPDIIIVHTPPYYKLVSEYEMPSCYKIAYDHGEPFPELFPLDEKARAKVILNKNSALKRFQYHISISNFIKEQSGIQNSTVIYNGVDHISTIIEDNKWSPHEYLNIPKHSKIIVSLTRIGENEGLYKGYNLLILFKEKLKKLLQNETLVFVVMGKAVPKNNRAEEVFNNSGFIVLENVSEQIKTNFLKTCDLFISTSLWEGFNLPLAEAQYLGAAAISFSTGAHPEVCPYHFTSLFEMTHFSAELLKNNSLKKNVQEKGRRWVTNKFSWAKNGNALHDILCNLHSEVLLNYCVAENTENKKEILHNDLKRTEKQGIIIEHPITKKPIIRYKIINPNSLVSIIIPNKNHLDDLKNCINSIRNKSSWKNYEILIIENESNQEELFDYYKTLEKDDRIQIISWKRAFNYSAVNNFSARYAKGEFLLFLNNDTEIITPEWIGRMVEYGQHKEIGAVGSKLLFPDKTIQHGGIVIGINEVAANMDVGKKQSDVGYLERLIHIQNCSAVTGACLLCRKEVFEEINGFDENYPIALSDVDLCLKMRKLGYRIVWTPFAELFHHEMKTRGSDDEERKILRFQSEIEYFKSKWGDFIAEGDEYYNPALSQTKTDFSLKI